MPDRRRDAGSVAGRAALSVAALLLASLWTAPSSFAAPTESILDAVVKVTASVPAEARTADTLGRVREGSGAVIDDNGLVLTIGYLILEANDVALTLNDEREVRARVVAYDHATGFGLVRAIGKLGVTPLALGNSAGMTRGKPALAASFGGARAALGVHVVARRPFAGSWEYLLEDAIFTVPPHPFFGGAALIDETGTLVAIGSLIVPDAAEPSVRSPGNMFVPVDRLKPILGDLLALGRSSAPAHPWLGLNAEEVLGRVFVTRVPPSGPAASAGIKEGDILLTVGGQSVDGLADYYRKLWSLGPAGVDVPLTLLRGSSPHAVSIKSIDRADWLRTGMGY